MIPVLRYIHAIGTVRAATISIVTLAAWITVTLWTTEPIHIELIKSSKKSP